MKNNLDNILFIYAKKGKIKCYTADQLRGKELQLSLDGWSHTATINPALWIEDITNGRDPSDILDEIQFLKP
jgi:hypothetical protein